MYSIPGPVRGNQILISVSQNPLYFFENLDMVSRKLSFLEQKGAQFVITDLMVPDIYRPHSDPDDPMGMPGHIG